MAFDEILLDELGIGTVWVRRRMAEAGASVETPVVAVAKAEPTGDVAAKESQAPQAEASITKREEPVQARAPQAEARPAKRAESPSVDPDLPPLEAYDDLPWTDEAPIHEPSIEQAAAPDDIPTLDWDALAARVSDCQRCRLCERRTNTVFGVGDREADWMLIGEAPGENEDKQGEPFVGQAGKLLDNMLRSLTLSRESNVYIANVIKCRPPGNRNPELEEVARCEPFLQRQVALVKPKVIVALGRFAAQSLLKIEASIASLRGRVHEYHGVPVVVTYHPAYLLRSLPDKSKAWADLCLARGAYRDALEKLGVQPSADDGARKGAR
ncbi:Uracil-DNA glycosylase, family 4 [Candidatus Burkholderia verschuerenii]|uniref:Type-4 uracil-DNA glycosylase n=1 Tax=Candidatus Burkholderia verschuerenii TaxID=242163 RepID=A0A0L0MHD8_9BURK|nr:uracil-DNA glycosylase [Candidatus Burkholderia verschuerenii]KND61394.1 Uracil-DNA glycosylase, family 4 [Candidatus Burkholderia verschuerenii]